MKFTVKQTENDVLVPKQADENQKEVPRAPIPDAQESEADGVKKNALEMQIRTQHIEVKNDHSYECHKLI